MKTLELTLQNIKCDGCVNTIKTAMEKHSNVKEVQVNKETGKVIIVGDNLISSAIITELTALGYPEAKKSLLSKFFS